METCTNEQCDRLGEYHPSESMRSSTGCGLLRMRPHPPALSGDFSLRSQHEKIIADRGSPDSDYRSEEHTSELQSHSDLVCRLLLEKKKENNNENIERKY